jgi:hypothetical protein
MAEAVAVTRDSEAELVTRAQLAVSRCNWEVGECAAMWTQRFAKGRTDADFAELVGLSADQVYQRRRVWETFGDVQAHYAGLKWSHFYSALTWEDAAEALQWAHEIGATVAEMRAWRRALRGEDLEAPEELSELSTLAVEPSEVRAPFDVDPERAPGELGGSRSGPVVPVVAGVSRQADGADEYTPFRPDAMVAPSNEPRERAEPTIDQAVRRLATTLERCASLITADFRRQFAKAREKEVTRLWAAVDRLTSELDDLRNHRR